MSSSVCGLEEAADWLLIGISCDDVQLGAVACMPKDYWPCFYHDVRAVCSKNLRRV